MHFQFEVSPTKEFIFKPTQLDIYIGIKSMADDGVTEMIAVQTVLTETVNGGTIVETKDHIMPVAMLQPAIKDFKLGEAPEVDLEVLQQLLTPFHLQLNKCS